MVAIRLEDFGGLIPRASDRLLPQTAATVARNVKLLSGEVRGLRVPKLLQDFSLLPYEVKRAYRWEWIDVYGDTHEFWQTFADPTTDVLRSPILNDSYDRYYWCSETQRPVYNTRDRILAGDPPLYLGVPRPPSGMTAAVTGTDMYNDTTAETRAYVVTYMSAYGEESQPSDPVIINLTAGDTVTLSNIPTTVADSANRNITKRRIYRTVPGNASTSYFYVGEIADMVTTTYIDSADNDVIALNNILESTYWAEPPPELIGWVMMPNGYMVGWTRQRTICFSEPYRPHAWPAEYQVSTEFEIVGMAVWGTALVVGTKSQPYLGQGVTPQSFTMQKMDAVEPCLSRRGMVATVAGAYYPSLNGLVMVNAGGINVITTDVLTKEEWEDYTPRNIFAAPLGLQYIAFNSPSFGFVFNPTEPKTKLIEIDFFDQVTSVTTDKYTGNVYIVRAGRVFEWDPDTEERLYWQWRSKEFHLPKPVNFGAVKIKFQTQAQAYVPDTTNSAYLQTFNDARIQYPLNTLNSHVLNGPKSRNVSDMYMTWTEVQNRGPLGGSELYNFSPPLTSEPAITRFRAWAGGQLVYDNAIVDEQIMRLPVGFKRDVWQFELASNSNVFSVQIAETGKELEKV
jgi:hypothetical protein